MANPGRLYKPKSSESLSTTEITDPPSVPTSNIGDFKHNKNGPPMVRPAPLGLPLLALPNTPALTYTPPLSPQKDKKIVKCPKPHSKTALGRLTYALGDRSGLYQTNLTVEVSSNNESWTKIEKHKLKRQVIDRWLEAKELQPLKGTIFTETKSESKSNICRIFIQVCNKAHAETVKEILRKASVAMTDFDLKTYNKDGSFSPKAARCTVQEGSYIEATDREVLAILRRSPHILREIPGEPRRAVDPRLLECSNPHDKAAVKFALHTRIQPSIDIRDRKLHLDFDLVLCAPAKPVHKILSDLLGVAEPGPELVAKNIEAIARTLRGIYVRCIYAPKGKTHEGLAKAQMLRADEKQLGRRFRIKDIAILSKDETFETNVTKTKKIDISVRDYFRKVTLANNRPLDLKLPFVKDDTDAWIPIELLTIDGAQPLVSFGHRNDAVRNEVQRVLKKGGVHSLRQLGEALLSGVRRIALDDGTTKKPWLDLDSQPTFTGTSLTNADTKSDSPSKNKNNNSSSIGVLHIPCAHRDTKALDLIVELKKGLASYDYMVLEDKLSFKDDKILTGSSVMTSSKVQLLLAVIDDRKRSNEETRKIVGRLRRYTDLVLGVRMVCMTMTSMEDLFTNRCDKNTYLPASIRAKINFVLGGQNFQHPQLHELLAGSGIMIMGAHISHPGNSAEYSPSVTAVVASTDDTALQYTGTARVQETSLKTKRKTNSKIEDLESMLRDVINKWKGSVPSELIFFRDSVDFDDLVVNNECALIKRTANDILRDRYPFQKDMDLKLTYIVVNKNTALHYIPTDQPDANYAQPLDDYLAEGDNIGKYRYYIMKDDMHRHPDSLAKLAGCLNESSQLTAQYEQTAKALPLLWASKLADRMHSYFRSSMTLPPVVAVRRSHREGGEDLARRVKTETDAVQAVKAHLGLSSGTTRTVPWKPELDGTMFYL
ncbi:hypothetical protein EKO04_007911 [Ascochyta lentis]|uniref:Piwi domain-containing protein n=1 Tax=Ascochyta lentis TaxID=205686 RepID=A0A8H7IWK4_9PLEO|nr:hypothetical protein EKO04_007911 [Ascochyta lentis]